MMAYRLTTDKTWSQTLDDLAETFRKWGISAWSVEPTNPGRRAANRYQTATERSVALRFSRRGRAVELVMTEQDRAVDNLRVLYLVVEALRLNESRGYAEVLAEAARQLYPALPAPTTSAPTGPGAIDPYAVLYVHPDAPLAVCEAAYKALARRFHPDAGGNSSQMAAIVVAIEEIRKERSQ